jgi:dienelactone hydrolase
MIKKLLVLGSIIAFTTFFIACEPGNDDTDDYDLSEPGEYSACSYTNNLDSSAYNDAIVIYPCETSDGPFPAATLTGGISNPYERVQWLAEHVATYGVIVIAMTPTNRYASNTDIWKEAHIGGIEQLEEENDRSASPIHNMVDTDSLGIMGYSLGGGGALKAADELGRDVKAVLGLSPVELTNIGNSLYRNITAATVCYTGTEDAPDIVTDIYDALPNNITKAYVNFVDAVHFDWMDILSSPEMQVRFKTAVVAWLKYYLDGDASYYTYLNGDMQEAQDDAGWYDDYIYEE